MWKKIVVFVLAAVSLYAAVSVQADTKKEMLKKKIKAEKKPKNDKKAAAAVWEKDITKAIAAAKKSKKPVLLVHIAPQVNKNSKLFNKHIIQSKNLAKDAQNIILVKFEYKDLKNISKAAAAALKKYPLEKRGNIVVMPTVYLLNSNGEVLEKKAGFNNAMSPADYLKSFKSLKKFKKK